MLAIIRAVVAQGGGDETEAAAIDHVDGRRSLQQSEGLGAMTKAATIEGIGNREMGSFFLGKWFHLTSHINIGNPCNQTVNSMLFSSTCCAAK